ncbi:hypothetical protein GCM10020219_041780 [Nonomuraea dietziae]
MALSGLLIQAMQFGAFYSALGAGLPAAVVSLVQGLNPVVIVLASRVLGERIGAGQWAGFALGAAGVVLAVADRVSLSPLGVALCLAGLAGLSAGTLYQQRFVPRMHALTGTAVQLLVSAPAVGLACLAAGPVRVSELERLRAVGGVDGAGQLHRGVHPAQPDAAALACQPVSTVFFLTPAVTAVLAWLLAGQPLHPLAIAGLVLGGCGVLLANLSTRTRVI